MEKKCLYCGNPFIANKSFQKYCSKNCNNHARWNTTRSEQKKKAIQDAEIVINLYESDLWDNVKLAHHYCNTLKNDKVVSMA